MLGKKLKIDGKATLGKSADGKSFSLTDAIIFNHSEETSGEIMIKLFLVDEKTDTSGFKLYEKKFDKTLPPNSFIDLEYKNIPFDKIPKQGETGYIQVVLLENGKVVYEANYKSKWTF